MARQITRPARGPTRSLRGATALRGGIATSCPSLMPRRTITGGLGGYFVFDSAKTSPEDKAQSGQLKLANSEAGTRYWKRGRSALVTAPAHQSIDSSISHSGIYHEVCIDSRGCWIDVRDYACSFTKRWDTEDLSTRNHPGLRQTLNDIS